MFRKKKEKTPIYSPAGTKAIPKYTLVDFSAIKDWFSYGHNRTMSGLKLANAADIKSVELEQKYKNHGRNWNELVTIIAVMVIIGVIAFMMIMQFGNISEISDELSSCKGTRAEAQGRLNVCTEQLELYEPTARVIDPGINI